MHHGGVELCAILSVMHQYLAKKYLFYMSDRNCCKYDGIIHTAKLAVETRWVKVQGILFIYILYIILYINDVS